MTASYVLAPDAASRATTASHGLVSDVLRIPQRVLVYFRL